MADEVASAALQTSQKAIEVTLELIRMLAPLAEQLLSTVFHKSVDGINFVGGKIANAKAAGTVSNNALMIEAQKASSPISTTSNFLARDAHRITEKAKQYKIPIAIIGNGEKQTIEFLDRDKGVMEQIMNEVMQERINGAPQSVKCFSVNENSVSSLKAAFEENGIECQFIGSKDGKISCIYPAEYAEQVAVLKEDYKQMHSEVAEQCNIEVEVPETERQLEIKERISKLKNADLETRSETLDRVLSDMREKGAEFPSYSANNMKIIENAMPEAKQAAGKAFWESQGYKLNEDAKGVEIIAPEMDEKGNPVLDENGNQSFTTVTVYDISETNAYEKASAPEIAALQNEYAAEKASAFEMSDNKTVTISDSFSGKSVTLNADTATKESVSQILRDELGYSPAKADIAANKMCYELGLDKQKFFAKPNQLDNIDALKTNIRYESDDLTLRDIRFDAIKFKSGDTTGRRAVFAKNAARMPRNESEHTDTHVVLRNGDKVIGLTPAKMSDDEMKDLCVNQLGLSEYQAEKAVAKVNKIENQVRSQLEERTLGKDGIIKEIEIERTSGNAFTVRLGDKSRPFNFTTVNLEEKIAKEFGIPEKNARNVVIKAKNQSVLQNKINSVIKKKKTAAPETPKINIGKGLKKH